jgi:transcriptional regulator with XRE-family HTH domain
MNSLPLGRFLLAKRQYLGLSQREVARLVDISPQYLSDIEHGRRNPTGPELIDSLAGVLQVDAKYLHYLGGRFHPGDCLTVSPEKFGDAISAFRCQLSNTKE